MLIPENGGSSSMISGDSKEVGVANSIIECNRYLKAGWGILTVVPNQYYDEERGVIVHGIAYVVYRTVT